MTLTTRGGYTLDAESMIGYYGIGEAVSYGDDYGIAYRRGLLAEHVEHFVAAGGTVRTAASGRRWAAVGIAPAVPIVCSEIIAITTEDGPSDGRCGLDADADGFCEGHAYLATTHAEQVGVSWVGR